MATRESLVFALKAKAQGHQGEVSWMLLEAADTIDRLLKELKDLRGELDAEYERQAGEDL